MCPSRCMISGGLSPRVSIIVNEDVAYRNKTDNFHNNEGGINTVTLNPIRSGLPFILASKQAPTFWLWGT